MLDNMDSAVNQMAIRVRKKDSETAVLSEPLLQQRKSKYRLLKDKFIG